MTDAEKDRATQADIERILGELTQRAYAGEIRGIAVATVTDYGFSCQHAHFDKQKGPLLATVVLLQHDIVNDFKLQSPPPIDGE
jgi:hypothetical protein